MKYAKSLLFFTLFFSYTAVCESPNDENRPLCSLPEKEEYENKNFPEPRISQSVYNKIRQSIWKISNQKTFGTAFATGSNRFVTNFHVIFSQKNPLKNEDIKDFFLSQEQSEHKIQVKRILAVSITDDLVLLETVESVTNRLELENMEAESISQVESVTGHLNPADSPEHTNEAFFIFGYPQKKFRQAIKIEGTVYKDQYIHSFPVHLSNLDGVSGSPLLNTKGNVIGVIFTKIGSNLLGAANLNSLKSFLSEKRRTNCFKTETETMETEDCIEKAKKDTKIIIENKSNPTAPYQWVHLGFENSPTTIKKLYKESCEGGFILACVKYGSLAEQSYDFSTAKNNYEKACYRNTGMMIGCHRLGMFLEKRRDFPLAQNLYQRACKGGLMLSCHKLGVFLEKQGDFSKAKDHYQRACSHEIIEACVDTGFLAQRQGDIFEAKNCYETACENGSPKGCRNFEFLLDE